MMNGPSIDYEYIAALTITRADQTRTNNATPSLYGVGYWSSNNLLHFPQLMSFDDMPSQYKNPSVFIRNICMFYTLLCSTNAALTYITDFTTREFWTSGDIVSVEETLESDIR